MGADGFDSCWDGVLQHAPAGMFLANAEGRCLRANERLSRLIGLPAEAIVGMGWLSGVHPEDGPRVVEAWRAATSAGAEFRAEFRLGGEGSDTVTWVLCEANPVPAEGGVEAAWIGTLTDVSHQARRERGLAEEDAALRIAADNATETQVLMAVERGGRLRIDFVNRRFMKVAEQWRPGIAMSDLLGKSRDEAVRFIGFPEDLMDAEWEQFERAIATRQPVRFELAVPARGKVFFQETSITPVLNDAGELTHVLWSSHDVTAAREADEARRVGDLAFDHSSDMLALMRVEPDGALRNVRANARYQEAIRRMRPGEDLPDIEGMLRDDWMATVGMDPAVTRAESERYREAIEGREPVSFEWTIQTPAGVGTVETVITPVLDGAGECTHVIWSGRSVTDRRREEEELQASRESMNEAQAIAHVGSWTLDLTSGRLAWSDEIYRIFEIDPERFSASYEAFLNAIHPEDRELVDQAYTRSVKMKQPYAIGHRLLMPDGRIKHVFERGRTQYAEDGTPVRSVGTVQDLTERTLANQRLEESEELFRATFEQAAVGMILADLDGKIQMVNQRFAEITGYGVEELGSRSLSDLRILSANPGARSAFRDVSTGRVDSYSEERPSVHRDGSQRWVNLTISSLRQRGRPTRVIILLEDITARREAAAALEASEASLARAEKLARIGNWEWDLGTDELRWSQSAYELLGLDPAEVPSPTAEMFFNRVHPDDLAAFQAGIGQLFETGTAPVVEFRLVRADGVERIAVTQGQATYDAAGNPSTVYGFVQDITERRQIEQAALASEQRLRLMLEQVPAIVWTTDPDLRLTYVAGRPFVERGADVAAMRGRHLLDVWGDSERNRRAVEYHQQALAGETVTYEGSSSSTERTFRTTLAPLRDAAGGVVGVLAVSFNVTEEVAAAEALRRSEESLLRAESLAKVGSWEWDGARGVVSWSPEAYRQFGLTPVEGGAPSIEMVRALIHPEDLPLMDAARARFGESGDSPAVEYRVNAADGETRYIRSQSQVIRGADGRPTGLYGYMQDISEQKAIEDALRQSEAALLRAEALAKVGHWEWDFGSQRFAYSPEVLRQYGFRSDDAREGRLNLEEDLIRAHVHPDDLPLVVETVAGAIEGRALGPVEYRVQAADGALRHIRTEGEILRDQEGRATGAFGYARDVTEQKAIEQELLLKDQAIASSVLGITFADFAGNLTFVNQAFLDMWGYGDNAEVLGRSALEFWQRPELAQEALEALTTEGGTVGELVARRKDGTLFDAQFIASVILDGRGNPIGLMGQFLDVSDSRRAERMLAESEELFRATFEQGAVGLVICDLEGRFLQVNERFSSICGYSPEELGTMHFGDITYPDDLTADLDQYGRLLAGEIDGYQMEKRYLSKDGGVVWANLSVSGLKRDGVLVQLVGAIKDITDRKIAEEALRRSEASLLRTEQLAKIGTWEHSAVTGESRWSPEIYRQYGTSQDIFEKPSFREEVNTYVHADDRERVKEHAIEALRSGAFPPLEYRIVGLDGVVRDILREGELLYGEDGSIIGSRGFAQDITERKAAESALRRSEAALTEAERMAGIGSWEADLRTGKMHWSPEMYRRYGVTPEELGDLTVERARTLTESRVHPDDREALSAWLGRLLPGPGMPPFEYRFLSPAGEYRVVRSAVEVVAETGGPTPRLRGFAQDITEQRRAAERIAEQLQEKEVLLREIHHRVKNNLQVVSSLLFLQQQRTESEEVLEVLRESSNRVAAMALVHEKLYSSADLAVVEFRDYARDLAQSLFVSYGVELGHVRLVVEGSGLVLPLDRAIPAALIVNETVSNALKHAFPDGQRGQITIRVLEKEETNVIEIADDGVGIPPGRAQAAGTLGTRLIRRLAAQMGAAIEQTGPGTVYRLTFSREDAR